MSRIAELYQALKEETELADQLASTLKKLRHTFVMSIDPENLGYPELTETKRVLAKYEAARVPLSEDEEIK